MLMELLLIFIETLHLQVHSTVDLRHRVRGQSGVGRLPARTAAFAVRRAADPDAAEADPGSVHCRGFGAAGQQHEHREKLPLRKLQGALGLPARPHTQLPQHCVFAQVGRLHWAIFIPLNSVLYLIYFFIDSSLLPFAFSLGQSVEVRTIWALEISNKPGEDDPSKPRIRFVAGIHGNAAVGTELLLEFAALLCINYGKNPYITTVSSRPLLVNKINP